MARNPYKFAGNAPLEHGLGVIRKELTANPRNRHFAVVEVALHGDNKTFTDDETTRDLVVEIVEIDPVIIGDDINTIREIRDRARLNAPGGQVTLDQASEALAKEKDELAARRQNTGGPQ